VDWGALTARTTQPEPQPTGWSNRWYVTSRELGQGVLPESPGPGDVRPNWLGRIQPYGVYVPATYDPADPAPLTWVLHSLGVNHNQYSATAPRMLADLCERRGSICATTLGRAGDGWYFDEAELDFWEVWNRLASAYSLDTERTVLSGYSMGGFATYKLGLSHPHLFADAIVLAGPMTCGVRVAGDLRGGSADPGTPCAESSDTGPLVANGAWLPFHIAHGAADQLVPVTSVVEHIEQFKAAGNRYVFDLFPGEDHMAWSLQDGFGEITKLHGTPVRETTPGKVDYAFYGHWVRDDLGIGPAGAYWLTGLRARDASPGTLARVTGESAAQPDDPHAVVERLPEPIGPEIDPAEQGLGTPGVRTGQDWQTTGPAPAAREELTVAFTNVARATLDLPGAGFAFDRPGRIETTSDGEVDLLLDGLPEDVVVALDGAPVATAPRVAPV
jgi:pimeloyl-ACP methyl ester carboxylesterase